MGYSSFTFFLNIRLIVEGVCDQVEKGEVSASEKAMRMSVFLSVRSPTIVDVISVSCAFQFTHLLLMRTNHGGGYKSRTCFSGL